jgi:hypothetical protein
MIYEPPASTARYSLSPSPSSSSGDAEGTVPRALVRASSQRDGRSDGRSSDDDLEMQLEHLRGSFENRAAELGRRTAKVRDALNVAERIRAQPTTAIALGLACGAFAALVTPTVGKAATGLLGTLALRAGRKLAWQVAERAISELIGPGDGAERAMLEDRATVHDLRAEIL